ncbi:MAG: diguanylate cyclase response regulator [Pseudanabaena frigida]|uniref:Diguanylate cyclase response regulator n=1 Tax=Pseudanabaena frigida TaxID=945775 RepID=A0A2W4XYH6_9CYAN|nr:MAG: diguanylate cyclase response regulator [Pseudanabaena frigida]
MNFDSLPESKGSILLVDDLPENLKLLTESLSKLGYIVRSVISGSRALKTVKAKLPDIILLDVKMPEMDGYQVCEAFKNDPDLCDIPVLFISALDEAFDKLKAFKVGGVDYITKPFQIEEVVARLEAHLTIRKQHKILQNEIVKRKEIEEILYQSRAILSGILNTSLDGIAAMQAVRNPLTGDIQDFRCLAVNPIISKVLKRDREDLIGELVLRELLENLDPELFDRFVIVVETGESLDKDFYYPTGDSCWYHYVAVKLSDGFAIAIRDITARKQTELALQKSNYKLQEANHKLQLLANSDGLTQIANRRCFDDYLATEWQRHQREQNPLSLILIDIDYFKRYNDSNGHQGGDDCLIRVAREIAKVTQRPTDLVARYGGEEFAAILSNTNMEGALKVTTAIQTSLANLAIPHGNSDVSDLVTLSMGVASLIPTSELSPEDLISQADRAMYAAKHQGRNQAIAYDVT